MPPLPPDALFALYWSRQVCSRALPGVSLLYLESMALGKVAGPEAATAADDGLLTTAFGDAGCLKMVLDWRDCA